MKTNSVLQKDTPLPSKGASKQYAVKCLAYWEAVQRPHVILGMPQWRILATYSDGACRLLNHGFSCREMMEDYIDRFLPEFAGRKR